MYNQTNIDKMQDKYEIKGVDLKSIPPKTLEFNLDEIEIFTDDLFIEDIIPIDYFDEEIIEFEQEFN